MIIYVYRQVNIDEEETFEKIGVIDNATSVIWVKRFNDVGEFEIYIKASAELFELFQDEVFLMRDDSNVTMFVEKIQLITDDENGDYLTISGRSIECVLGWRVIDRVVYSAAATTAESIIRDLVNRTLIFMGSRQGPLLWLSLGENHNWPDNVTRQFTGKIILDIIRELCVTYNYGFEMVYNNGEVTFELYKGTNRSFDQTENPFVVFSPEFENLGNTEYLHDVTNYANGVLIGGEGEGTARTFVWVDPPKRSRSFNRRYIYIDARNSSSDELTADQYKTMLENQGTEALEQRKIVTSFNGEILNYNNYTYGVDYNLGDKVSVINEYGIKGNATITEITEVEDATGYRLIPTLSEWTIVDYETED